LIIVKKLRRLFENIQTKLAGFPDPRTFRPPCLDPERKGQFQVFICRKTLILTLCYLNAKDISTIVKALRITNINTSCDFVAEGFIKI